MLFVLDRACGNGHDRMHVDTKTNLLMRLLVTASSTHVSARSFWDAEVYDPASERGEAAGDRSAAVGNLWPGLTEELLIQILMAGGVSSEEEKAGGFVGRTAALLRMAALVGRVACTSRSWRAAAATDTVWGPLFRCRWGSDGLSAPASEGEGGCGVTLQAAYRERHREVSSMSSLSLPLLLILSRHNE